MVVSHDGFNEIPTWRSVIVVPVSTSVAQARRGPTVVPLPMGAGGIPEDSVALCHQVTPLDRSKLTSPLGELPESLIHDIGEALKIAQGLL
jgi:mRNA interferase MazF